MDPVTWAKYVTVGAKIAATRGDPSALPDVFLTLEEGQDATAAVLLEGEEGNITETQAKVVSGFLGAEALFNTWTAAKQLKPGAITYMAPRQVLAAWWGAATAAERAAAEKYFVNNFPALDKKYGKRAERYFESAKKPPMSAKAGIATGVIVALALVILTEGWRK